MPLYEYACRKCESEFELLIRGEEAPECPHCGSRKLDKLLSVAAAHTAGAKSSLPVCGLPSREACGQPQCCRGRCGMG